jgi:hypothetical protein
MKLPTSIVLLESLYHVPMFLDRELYFYTYRQNLTSLANGLTKLSPPTTNAQKCDEKKKWHSGLPMLLCWDSNLMRDYLCIMTEAVHYHGHAKRNLSVGCLLRMLEDYLRVQSPCGINCVDITIEKCGVANTWRLVCGHDLVTCVSVSILVSNYGRTRPRGSC